MQRVHFGPARESTPFADLDWREYAMMLGLMALVLLFGLYPQPLLDTTGDVMANVQALFSNTPMNTMDASASGTLAKGGQ
jgi:NADH-quinone oxidoreductase subunit M